MQAHKVLDIYQLALNLLLKTIYCEFLVPTPSYFIYSRASMYNAMGIDKVGIENHALDVWKDALSNVMPHVEVRSRRVGGATFQIPSPIRSDRKISIAMKWLINYSRKRNEKSMAQKLAAEVLAAAKEEGAAVKKKVDTHKMAEANKAFSHFRF